MKELDRSTNTRTSYRDRHNGVVYSVAFIGGGSWEASYCSDEDAGGWGLGPDSEGRWIHRKDEDEAVRRIKELIDADLEVRRIKELIDADLEALSQRRNRVV